MKPLKTVNREAVKASRNLCGLSENYHHHDSFTGLGFATADKEGCFVVMPDGIYGEKVSEAIKKLLTGNLYQLAVVCAWLVRKLSSS